VQRSPWKANSETAARDNTDEQLKMTYAADAVPPFYHGTRADLKPGDLLSPGFRSNYAERELSWIYISATLDAAIWGCELAKGEGRERIYIVEPTGVVRRPNLTDEKFPGNPTSSYRSRAPRGDEGRACPNGSRRRRRDRRLKRGR
jgi:hypothetical protein